MTNNSIKKEEKQDFLKFNNKKKKKNIKLADVIKDKVGETTLTAIQNCSYFMKFYANVTLEKRKLMMANSCNNRFCPMCAYRKARKDGLKHMIMMKKLKIDKKYSFIFLTLTAPSVTGENLRKEVIDYAAAFQKLAKLKEFQNMNVGYVRKLEITYNKERDDYNPHFHVILSVNKSYFTDSDYYISQEKWLNMWRDVTGLNGITENGTDEITQLHIAKVRKGVGKNSQGSTISEIAKYSAKDSDMFLSEDIFDVFYSNLKGRQLLTFNGLFKEYKKKFDNKELEKYFSEDENEYIWKLLATWNQEYQKYEQLYELLSDEEFKHFNNKNIVDEMEID